MGAGLIALAGDLPGTVTYLQQCGPLVAVPLKGLIAFPLVYHYLSGAALLLLAKLWVVVSMRLSCTVAFRTPS